MRQFARIAAALWLLPEIATALPAPVAQLERLPRSVWDTENAKRNAAADEAVGLAENEEFMWASHGEQGKKAVVVSMVAFARQDERILDMDKFSFALESASCDEEELSMEFKHVLIYYAAKIAWNWVNYNEYRSFVLVPSWKGCGEDQSQHPWVVRGVKFDDKTRKVILDGTRSTWKRVMNSFTIDFGEVVLGRGRSNDKRDTISELEKRVDIIPDLSRRFSMDVGMTLPTKIFEWKKSVGPINATLTANCNECGTTGNLVFEGHVEGHSDWDFPNPVPDIVIDRFDISIIPEGVGANVDLSLEFVGQLDFKSLAKPSQEINLLDIPLSGWNIPNILEIGPRVQLNAGYEIDYVMGSASASAGVSAMIPDSSIAKLDLLSEDSVEISGWVPEIETRPLEVTAQVDAQASIYTEIALSVSFMVLEDTGFGVDLAFKVPEVTVTVSAGYDSVGFCPNNADPWGLNIEATVGVDLDLEGWTEVDGDRKELFEVEIFEKPDLFEFPGFCLAFDTVSEGYCHPQVDKEDREDDDDDDDFAKRSTDLELTSPNLNSELELASRQNPSSRDPVYPKCAPNGERPKYGVKVLSYPGPTSVKEQGTENIPIAMPKIACPSSTRNCGKSSGPNQWGIDVETGKDYLPAITTSGDDETKGWNSEHVYEGNWIAAFMDHLNEEVFSGSPDQKCKQPVLDFWDKKPAVDIPTKPSQSDPPNSWMTALLQQLGTDYTYTERMAMFPSKLNGYKNLIFNGKPDDEIIGRLNNKPGKRDTGNPERSCDLGRIIVTCLYMNDVLISRALLKTAEGIESVLKVMDDNNISKPPKEGDTLVKIHEKWLNEVHAAGIKKARTRLKEYAQKMTERTNDWGNLDKDIKDKVTAIKNLDPDSDEEWVEYCPKTNRDKWGVEPAPDSED